MRVLLAHNRYVQPGGEDVAFEQEARLLRERGHEIRLLEQTNTAIEAAGLPSRGRLFAETIWSPRAYRATRRAIRAFRPDILHVHNSFPLLSPAIYHAAWAENVAVV